MGDENEKYKSSVNNNQNIEFLDDSPASFGEGIDDEDSYVISQDSSEGYSDDTLPGASESNDDYDDGEDDSYTASDNGESDDFNDTSDSSDEENGLEDNTRSNEESGYEESKEADNKSTKGENQNEPGDSGYDNGISGNETTDGMEQNWNQNYGEENGEKYKANENSNAPVNNEKDDSNKKSGPDRKQNQGGNNEKEKKKNNNLKDRVDKAKKDVGNNPDKQNKKDDTSGDKHDKKDDNQSDKKDNSNKKDGQNGNSNEDSLAKKKIEEKKKKIIAAGKKDINLGNATSKNALKYAAIKPGDYTKDVARRKVLTLIRTYPIPSVIVIVSAIVIFLIFMGILGCAGESSGGSQSNKYAFSRFEVIADEDTYSLEMYALSATYQEFYIRNSVDKMNSEGMSENQFKNMFKAFALLVKTTALEKGGFNSMTGDYSGEVNDNDKDDYPTACHAVYGCDIGYWDDNYYAYPSDKPNDEKDFYRRGLYSWAEGTTEKRVSKYLTEALSEVTGKIVAPGDKKAIIIEIDESFDIPCIEKKEHVDFIIEQAKAGYNFVSIINNFVVKFGGEDKTAQVYNIYDYIIDEDTVYYDVGYWWPIGSKTADSEGLYSGTPTSTHISSYFGLRNLTKGVDDHHGIDISGVGNGVSPVIATADGTVKRIFCQSLTSSENCKVNKLDKNYSWGGCQIFVEHDEKLFGMTVVSKYLHLNAASYDKYVVKDQKVKKGQILAMAGSTGCSDGYHLHFQVEFNGKPVNPLGVVSPKNPRPQ